MPKRSVARFVTVRACLLSSLCFVVASVASAADSDLPRYWLKVGQELSYQTTSEMSTADGQSFTNESTWQVWVVKQNSDGTWRLVLRHATTFQLPANSTNVPAKGPAKGTGEKSGTNKPASGKPAAPGGKPTAKAAPVKPAAPARGNAAPAARGNAAPPAAAGFPEQVTFAYCDFSPDGAVTPNATLGFQFEVRQLLPKLPKTEKELEKGWTDLDKTTQVAHRYKVEEGPGDDDDDDDEPEWTIVATRQSPIDDIYLCKSQSKFFFDADRGFVERIESSLDQGYGVKGTVKATTKLLGVEQFDDAWCKKLDDEMGHYFGLQRRYQHFLKEAQRNSSEAETLLVEAGAILQKAAADITLPVVKEDLGKQVAQHAAMIGLTARAARDRADLIDQPAPTWQTKDLDGKAHALKDYKGKVVVLHFWRRNDGWGLRSLPQVEQLAEQFTDKPVVVLGMNTEENETDARFVADKMGLAYPILRADKFADRYNAAAGSAVFIVDQKGVVRDIYLGYSPTLKEDVAAAVNGLLSSEEK
ncbi:MAG TPA: TlpA disulfide reductase family protein [Pirellulales bacterium]|nr:TlpA disulfide reductase family protein [Pirellulales bacterium]